MPKYQIKVKHFKQASNFGDNKGCPQALAANDHFKRDDLFASVTKICVEGEDFAKHVFPKGRLEIIGPLSYGYDSYLQDFEFLKENPDADPEMVLHEYEYELV